MFGFPFPRCLILIVLALFLHLNTTSADMPNRVLELDGQGDYVELPPGIFSDLDEATIEAWVKWDAFGAFSQPWGFGSGGSWNVMAINNATTSSDLQFFIYDQMKLNLIQVPHVLRAGKWVHLAAVSGPSGMKLYLNGVQLGEHDYPGSFSALGRDEHNYLGKPHWPNNSDFQGQIDEVRVWNFVRTPEQIREGMFRRMTGVEAGLVGLWNFDSGDARDAAGNHDGRMHGGSRCVAAELPSPDELKCPVALSGIITGEQAYPLTGADVRLEQMGVPIVAARTDAAGRYQLAFYPPSLPWDLSATWNEMGDWQQGIHIESGEHLTLDLQLQPAVSIIGTLMAYDNSSHKGVLVQAEPVLNRESGGTKRESGPGNSQPAIHSVISALSDENGQYRFINLKPGAYRVRVYVGDRYVYYEGAENQELETGRRGTTVQRSNVQRSNLQPGTVLHVTPGRTLSGIDLHFAPFKKGVWRTYTYLDGLSSNRVYAVARDTTGFLWFGTEKGVSRYDGKSFVSFTSEDGLAPNPVRAIEAASDGTLWFGTDGGGLSHYDGRTFRNFTQIDGLINDQIRALRQDPHGMLWIGTQGGLSRYDGKTFTSFTRADGLPSDRIRALCVVAEGVLWIGTQKGLSRYDGTQFTNFTSSDGLPHNTVTSLHWDSRGVLWIGTQGGLSAYDGERFVTFTVQDGLPDPVIGAIGEDTHGTLWFGGNHGGICSYDQNGFVSYTKQDGLVDDRVKAIYCAQDGLVWLGTIGGGVSCYSGTTLVNFTPRDGLAPWVSAIMEDTGGNLWFGTREGAYRYDGNRFLNIMEQHGLSTTVNAICQRRDGSLWFGTMRHGVIRYNGQRFRELNETEGLAFSDVNALYPTSEGKLWVGVRANGLSVLDTRGLTFRTWTERDGLPGDHTRAICQDGSGDLWFGFRQAGAARFDGERFTTFTVEDGLPNNTVNVIRRDDQGVLWFGTENGLSRYDGEQFVNLTTRDGLVDNYILAIHHGSNGRMWLGTDSGGVALYDGTVWTSLDVRDGLNSNHVRSIYEDEEGTLWFGTTNGVTRYRLNRSRPVVYIASLQTDRERFDTSTTPTITTGRRATIAYQSIDFRTSPQKRQYLVRILKQGDGGGEESEQTIGSPLLSRHLMSPTFDWTPDERGTYVLEVQAIDRDLNYSEPASLTIEVVSPWYLNGWIVLPSGAGMLALLVAVTVLGWRTYARRHESQQLRVQLLGQEREKNAQLQKAKQAADLANRAKSIFLANMSHEIRTPLNAILGYAQLLQRDSELPAKQRSAVGTIEESGNHLLALINDVLDISRIEAGRIERQEADFDLRMFIEGLARMFQLRCESKGLLWRVETPVDGLRVDGLRVEKPNPQRSFPNPQRLSQPATLIVHGDEGKLRQVLINLLSNAVKFTEEGSVTLKIGVRDQGPRIRDQDANVQHSNPQPATCKPAEMSTGALYDFRLKIEDCRSKISNLKSSIQCSNAPMPQSLIPIIFEVIDTGPGIPAEEQRVIFEPFQQGKKGVRAGGTGLGLAIAQRYVELMGGSLHVESEVGRGSRFFFSLMFAQATSGRGAASDREVIRLVEGTHVKALVADDVPENRDILVQLLSDIGVRVQTVSDGRGALEVIFEGQPDIAFLDIRMPVVDGFQVMREVLARRQTDADYCPPRLVAVSASAMIHQRKEYREAGFDDFLAKPVRAEEVYECLARLLRIEYEMGGNRGLPPDLSTLLLPGSLLQHLRESVELGRVTEFEKALPELSKLGETETQLAEYLGELSRNLDMQPILDLLGAIHSE